MARSVSSPASPAVLEATENGSETHFQVLPLSVEVQMSAPDRSPAAGSTRGSWAAYGAMSEAVQNWPAGLTPMPGSPSSLRVRPVPGAGGSGWLIQVVPAGEAAAAETAPLAVSRGVRA